MKEREWILGDDTVDELYEYKNLGVLKNYIASFSSIVEDNIDKTRRKAEIIFSSNFDRRKVDPFNIHQVSELSISTLPTVWL